jgi:hypothetical protein
VLNLSPRGAFRFCLITIVAEEIFPLLIAGARIVFRTESMPLDAPLFARWIEQRRDGARGAF